MEACLWPQVSCHFFGIQKKTPKKQIPHSILQYNMSHHHDKYSFLTHHTPSSNEGIWWVYIPISPSFSLSLSHSLNVYIYIYTFHYLSIYLGHSIFSQCLSLSDCLSISQNILDTPTLWIISLYYTCVHICVHRNLSRFDINIYFFTIRWLSVP